MAESIPAAILETLGRVRPQSVLAVGSEGADLVRPYLEAHPDRRLSVVQGADLLGPVQAVGRHDLAVLAGALDALEPVRAGRLIAALRDLLAPVCLIVLRRGQARIGHGDMLGYGFERLAQDESAQGARLLYLFAIDSYKRTPDWLNPRHWANPERWDKHRW